MLFAQSGVCADKRMVATKKREKSKTFFIGKDLPLDRLWRIKFKLLLTSGAL